MKDRWYKSMSQEVMQETWLECLEHERLCNYQPGPWLKDREWRVNCFLHCNDISPAQSRSIARLIVGGQMLRGGDCATFTHATVNNCCVWCLQQGVKVVESLTHVIWECDCYKNLRVGGAIQQILQTPGAEVLLLHRSTWRFTDLEVIRRYLLKVVSTREAFVGKSKKRAAQLQEQADALWF